MSVTECVRARARVWVCVRTCVCVCVCVYSICVCLCVCVYVCVCEISERECVCERGGRHRERDTERGWGGQPGTSYEKRRVFNRRLNPSIDDSVGLSTGCLPPSARFLPSQFGSSVFPNRSGSVIIIPILGTWRAGPTSAESKALTTMTTLHKRKQQPQQYSQ